VAFDSVTAVERCRILWPKILGVVLNSGNTSWGATEPRCRQTCQQTQNTTSEISLFIQCDLA